jgi:hypothetical protein
LTNEYGTDPVLKCDVADANAGALTMISKRLEKGEQVDVRMAGGPAAGERLGGTPACSCPALTRNGPK